MVNILCRAGKFHEVVNFIDEMKLTQKTLIWETVLWASKMHGSVEVGQKAAGKLFELDPKMDCDYVMLSEYWQLKEDRMMLKRSGHQWPTGELRRNQVVAGQRLTLKSACSLQVPDVLGNL